MPWRPLLALGGIAVAFLAGIGLGEALHDNPDPGRTQTLIRTLDPLPLVPVAHNTEPTRTVTITTSSP
jgi:hypothetical protein